MSSRARLVISHAAALILGILAGNIYWTSNRAMAESDIWVLERKPVADASRLAFRFGPREHARLLLEDLRRFSPQPAEAAGEEMFVQIHLAALDGEHEARDSGSPHLLAASVACQQFNTNCAPSRMKALAARLALLRPQP